MSKVLVAEDDGNIREIIAFALKELGIAIEVAKTGDQAEQLLDENTFDLVILDVMMPGVTGFEIADKIHARQEQGPKILMLSAISQGTSLTDTQMRTKAKVDAYISKPFKLSELTQKVKELLGL